MGEREDSLACPRRWKRLSPGKRSPMASQNSIEEELSHQGRVPGITNDEAPKQSPNPSHPNCGSPSPSKFACCVNVPELALLWKLCLGISKVKGPEAAKLLRLWSISIFSCFITTADSDPLTGPPDKGGEWAAVAGKVARSAQSDLTSLSHHNWDSLILHVSIGDCFVFIVK